MRQLVPIGLGCVKPMIAFAGPSLASDCEGSHLITSGDCDNETHWGLENENVSTRPSICLFLKDSNGKGLKQILS